MNDTRRGPHSQPAASQGTPIHRALRGFAAAVAGKRAHYMKARVKMRRHADGTLLVWHGSRRICC